MTIRYVGARVSLSVKPSAPFNISRRILLISAEFIALKIIPNTVYDLFTTTAFETKKVLIIDRKTALKWVTRRGRKPHLPFFLKKGSLCSKMSSILVNASIVHLNSDDRKQALSMLLLLGLSKYSGETQCQSIDLNSLKHLHGM